MNDAHLIHRHYYYDVFGLISYRVIQIQPGFRNREYQYESMMQRTGVKSVILRKLFPLIERIGHRSRRGGDASHISDRYIII